MARNLEHVLLTVDTSTPRFLAICFNREGSPIPSLCQHILQRRSALYALLRAGSTDTILTLLTFAGTELCPNQACVRACPRRFSKLICKNVAIPCSSPYCQRTFSGLVLPISLGPSNPRELSWVRQGGKYNHNLIVLPCCCC